MIPESIELRAAIFVLSPCDVEIAVQVNANLFEVSIG